jgi:hypothetical protein
MVGRCGDTDQYGLRGDATSKSAAKISILGLNAA